MSAVNKEEVAARVKAKLGLRGIDEKDLTRICDAMFETVLDAVKNGEDVVISDFGKFYARFIRGKTITETGIPWIKGKYIIPDRLRLGFKGSIKAHKAVGRLMSKLTNGI